MTEQEYKRLLNGKLIIYRKSLDLPKNITFGVEIEYENIVVSTLSHLLLEESKNDKWLKGWESKREFDIGEYNHLGEEINGEVSSKILMDDEKNWGSLKNVLNIIRENDGIITEKCGGHVNIGTHILERKKEYFRNFLLLWILYEQEIYKFSSGDYVLVRYDYDRLLEKISEDIDIKDIINIRKFNYFSKLPKCLFDKRHDVFIDGTIKKEKALENRIEFRIPNGSLEEEIWQNYINFFAKFLIACTKELDVEKTLYKIEKKEHNAVELADYVFNEEIDKENFLIQTLKTNKIYKKELPKHIIY